jgi:hypothetical protein
MVPNPKDTYEVNAWSWITWKDTVDSENNVGDNFLHLGHFSYYFPHLLVDLVNVHDALVKHFCTHRYFLIGVSSVEVLPGL